MDRENTANKLARTIVETMDTDDLIAIAMDEIESGLNEYSETELREACGDYGIDPQ